MARGKVNRSSMPEKKSAAVKPFDAQDTARHQLERARERRRRGMGGFSRKEHEHQLAKTAAGESKLRRGTKTY